MGQRQHSWDKTDLYLNPGFAVLSKKSHFSDLFLQGNRPVGKSPCPWPVPEPRT